MDTLDSYRQLVREILLEQTKIWIQRDGTELGIANEFVNAGVPKEHIVLGFRSPEMRKITEFAVA